jgi:hypothetical protein
MLWGSGISEEIAGRPDSIFSRNGNLSGKTLKINTAMAKMISHQYFFKIEVIIFPFSKITPASRAAFRRVAVDAVVGPSDAAI